MCKGEPQKERIKIVKENNADLISSEKELKSNANNFNSKSSRYHFLMGDKNKKTSPFFQTKEAFLERISERYIECMKESKVYWGGDMELGVIAKIKCEVS